MKKYLLGGIVGGVIVLGVTLIIIFIGIVIFYVSKPTSPDKNPATETKEAPSIFIFFNVGTDEELIFEFRSELKRNGWQDIEYTSTEQAIKEFTEEISNNDLTKQEVAERGLPANLNITVKSEKEKRELQDYIDTVRDNYPILTVRQSKSGS